MHEASTRPSPAVAALLSALLPGLGQLANGERVKGLAVLASALGVWSGAAISIAGPAALRSWLSLALLVAVYPALWLPAVLDAWRSARGLRSPLLAGERVWYVLMLLAVIGPLALPLLWSSRRFPNWVKLLLTLLVIGVALAAIAFAVWIGPILERTLGDLGSLLLAGS